MSWIKYSSRYRTELYRLLEEKEHEAVSFCSNFLKKNTQLPFSDHKEIIYLNINSDNNIDCAVMLSASGQVLPVIKGSRLSKDVDFKIFFKIANNRIYYLNSFMGNSYAVDSIFRSYSDLTGIEKITEYTYHTMTVEKSDFSPFISAECGSERTLRSPDIDDIYSLLPLQEAYEKEEVLPSPDLYNSSSSIRYLKNSIKNQISLIYETDGRIVAKANTNSRGINCYQIGGVFTLPEYRNMGIGKFVTSELVKKIIAQDKKPTLFVRESNPAAISVYRKLGFTITSPFKIIYLF